MAFCKNCGMEIPDNSSFRPGCGFKLKEPRATPIEEDYVALWGVLGFLIPIVGIILWAVWMNDKPKSSKAAGIGALIGIVLSILITVIIFVVAINAGINLE